MQTLVAGIVVVLLAVLGLSAGVLLGRPPLKGSCGGLGCGGACEACPRAHGDERQ